MQKWQKNFLIWWQFIILGYYGTYLQRHHSKKKDGEDSKENGIKKLNCQHFTPTITLKNNKSKSKMKKNWSKTKKWEEQNNDVEKEEK